MVLRQLEYLVALAREKHFGRAAEACHVSQPTLSAAIRLLEEELGAPIVERGHRYVGLTPQGQVALEHAHRILAEVENLRRGLEEIDKGLTGRLRIGAIPTALPIVSHLTGPFFERFPGVTVAVCSLNSQDIDRGIEDFELDAGLTYLDAEPLGRVKHEADLCRGISVPHPSDRPVRRPTQVTWREAAERAFVPAHARHAEPADHRRRLPLGRGDARVRRWRPTRSSTSSRHVSSGQWSSIVPRQLLRFFGLPETTRAIELIEPTARRTIGLVITDREPPSPARPQPVRDAVSRRHCGAVTPPNPLDRGRILVGLEGRRLDSLFYRAFRRFNLNPRPPERMIVALFGRKVVMSGRTAFDADLARTLIDRKRGDAWSDAADPARSAGRVRLYRRARHSPHRGRAQRLESRNARRDQLLSRFPPLAGRRRGC